MAAITTRAVDRGRTARVLLTGMSGTGKSSVVAELAARGHRAVDLDDGYCVTAEDGEWVFDEQRLDELLADGGGLFLAGTARNQRRFYDRLDLVILLSAPLEVMLARIATRTNNPFGSTPAELDAIRADLESVEPLLRDGASCEIDTDRPLAAVVDAVLVLAAR